jgi:hypothetical protein
LTGNKVSQPRSNVALHSKKARSFVDGNWKLVDFSYSITKTNKSSELYNLLDDQTESNDLAIKEPERLKSLKKKLDQITNQGDSK